MRRMGRVALCSLLAVAAALTIGACGNLTTSPTTTTGTYVYAVDTYNGHVYQVDPSTKVAATEPIVTIGQNSSGEIRFRAGKGFVAVASYGNTAPGLYYFDPSSPSPAATRIGTESMSVQYIYIVSDTLGYVSVADYTAMGKANNGVYSFDPSSPSSGLTAVYTSSTSYPQDLVMGSDGYLYVSNDASSLDSLNSDCVLKVDLSSKSVVASYSLTRSDPIGLLVGSYNGSAGVFVAESGSYDSSWQALDGAIDFIPEGASVVTKVKEGIPASRLAAFDSSTLIVTGGYPSHSNIVTISGTTVSTTEAFYDTSTSFGSSDVDILDGVAYVPAGNGDNIVYAVTSSGSTTKISVGSSTSDNITNVGIGSIEQ